MQYIFLHTLNVFTEWILFLLSKKKNLMGLKCLDVGLITTFKTHTDTCFYVCIYLGEIGYHCAIFVSVESCQLLEMRCNICLR